MSKPRGRIFYLAPDVPFPSGGANVMYAHVAMLRELGGSAAIAHRNPDFRYAFARHAAPVVGIAACGLGRDDALVVAEDDAVAIRDAAPLACEKILFCQGHFNLVHGLEPGAHWRHFGFTRFLCVSEQTRMHLAHWFGVDAQVVPPVIEARPERPRNGRLTVAFMPRKGFETLKLLRLLLSLDARYAAVREQVEWVALDRAAPAVVDQVLGQADVFLATGRWEGLGLPPLEAMAAGCIPVGYAAGGGLDYSEAAGVWVPDEDVYALAEALVRLLADLARDRDDPRLVALRDAGRRVAARYTDAAARSALGAFWSARLRRRQPAPA